MSWVSVGAAAVSAGAGIYGSQQAADAQGDAAKKNAALQRQNMMMQLGITEPQRALGYGALSDLGSLYGYSLPGYQTNNQLMNPAAGTSGPISVNGRGGGANGINPGAPLGLNDPLSSALGIGGSQERRFGGTINPLTGTVDITNGGKKAGTKEALLTEYLRTGVMPKGLGQQTNRFVKEIDRLRGAGYQYDPNAAAADANFNPAGQGQAGNMSRFFTSPDYQFRRDEGQRGIGNSFAARGGAASGNALRALSEFNGNLASGEFNNYTNRLMRMAGMGESANTQASNAYGNYTNGMQQSNQQQGDARASGILGTTNSIGGFMGDLAGAWGARQQQQKAPQNSLYGPYAGGYQGASLPQQPKQWNYLDSLNWRG